MVRKGRDLRRGERRARDGWNVGASRNWKGVRGIGIGCGEEGREGGGKTQPRVWRRSAEPEDEVDALLPCCVKEKIKKKFKTHFCRNILTCPQVLDRL